AEGEVLPIEQELADSLHVGRNALREAVKVLSGKGLIQTAPRSGTWVRHRDDWNLLDPDVLRWHADPNVATRKFMLDLLEMRRIIEPKAAELAAVRASRKEVGDILSAYEEMSVEGISQAQRIEANIRFHAAILKASHNTVLNHFRFAIAAYLKAHAARGLKVSAADDRADLERHRLIAMAIATGKAKSAYSLSVEMLRLNRSHFEEQL
ncbi:MAG: FadR family transcriptional regulator, partial [Halioglobus sp.]|nr:FadR family transcriptional regulator [Halioglobus sp.]